jgi:hypothetical protein
LSDCLVVATATVCAVPTGWATFGYIALGSITELGTDTFSVVVVSKTVEVVTVAATGTLMTGEPSGRLGVVVETIGVAKWIIED